MCFQLLDYLAILQSGFLNLSTIGNSLVVQWLGLKAFTVRPRFDPRPGN